MAELPKGSKGWLKYNCRCAAGSEMDNVTDEKRKRAWMRLMRRFLEALALGSGEFALLLVQVWAGWAATQLLVK